MKILVAADGSGKLRNSALPAIANLADDVIPEVIVLNVVRAASEAWSDEELKQVMAKRQHRMEALVADADFAVQVLVEALPYGGEVSRYITLRATDLEADAILVTSKRATGLIAGLLGSVAQGILRDSELPVIVVRPADVPEDEDDEGFD
jgi:nucleotide-binding universal stress UspA family protein